MYARTCHQTALSHCVRPTAAPTRAVQVMVRGALLTHVQGRSERDECVGTHTQGPAATVTRAAWSGSRPRTTRSRWVADVSNPPARERLWHAAVGSMCTHASSAVVHPGTSPHLLGDRLVDFRETAVDSACSLCQGLMCTIHVNMFTSPTHVRILDLLLGLKRPGNTDGATLNTCYSASRVSLACAAGQLYGNYSCPRRPSLG